MNITCFAIIPYGVGEPPMGYKRYLKKLEKVIKDEVDLKEYSSNELYEIYYNTCKENNCSDFEVRGFATTEETVYNDFEEIKKNNPNAVLIEPNIKGEPQ